MLDEYEFSKGVRGKYAKRYAEDANQPISQQVKRRFSMANVSIHHEVGINEPSGWRLCFQWVTYQYDDGTSKDGYRFIWRFPNGNLEPARGQARIPSAARLLELLSLASQAGWFVAVEPTPPAAGAASGGP